MVFKKIRKGHVDWRDFLCGTPASDYIFQKDAYEEQIENAVNFIKDADAVIIGAGAGASTAAGLEYGGKRFTDHFAEFIEKYGGHYMTDMYAAGFYPFPSEEARWGYWSKHALLNRFDPPALPLYQELYSIVKDKDYFVLTTNVDHQFQKAGFDKQRLFYTQGDYGLFQCSKPCHRATYDNEEVVREMLKRQKDMKIPTGLIPHCPVCGKPMTMNLRADDTFVQDDGWYRAAERYSEFLCRHKETKMLLLELGVGMNTPGIIKYPFWQMAAQNPNAYYVSINAGEAYAPEEIRERAICVNGDIGEVICRCH